MPNNKNFRIENCKCSYSILDKAYTYACPHKDLIYPGINNGYNCLCVKPFERTIMDKIISLPNRGVDLFPVVITNDLE
jgi:hypothetical protein